MTKEEKIIRKKQERKEFKEYIDLSDDRVLNTKKVGIELIAKDEIFVQIPDAEHYWISNYGRLVNNNNKHKTFKFHKMPENNKKYIGRWYRMILMAHRYIPKQILQN